MSNRKYIVIQILAPEEVSGYSEAQKAHYLSLGYMPCLLANGNVKWLTESQRNIRATKAQKPFFRFGRRPKPLRRGRGRKRHRSQIRKFLLENWKFISLILALVIVLWILLIYWNQIFGL